MISIDEFEIVLNECAEQLPQEFYHKLNGGILLLPEEKRHPENLAVMLCIMGEYHQDTTGRYIVIYYGSFARAYGHYGEQALRAEIDKTLRHEFTHHLESLAGERGLEIKDAQNMRKWREME